MSNVQRGRGLFTFILQNITLTDLNIPTNINTHSRELEMAIVNTKKRKYITVSPHYATLDIIDITNSILDFTGTILTLIVNAQSSTHTLMIRITNITLTI